MDDIFGKKLKASWEKYRFWDVADVGRSGWVADTLLGESYKAPYWLDPEFFYILYRLLD